MILTYILLITNKKEYLFIYFLEIHVFASSCVFLYFVHFALISLNFYFFIGVIHLYALEIYFLLLLYLLLIFYLSLEGVLLSIFHDLLFSIFYICIMRKKFCIFYFQVYSKSVPVFPFVKLFPKQMSLKIPLQSFAFCV